MKNVAIVACVDKNNGLGKDGRLLYQLKSDMKFFKDLTTDHIVIMGKRTYESIGKPLPDRTNFVLSKNDIEGINTLHNLDELNPILFDKKNPEQKFIIGGASLYNIYINEVDKIYLTEVDSEKEADTFFPSFTKTDYTKTTLQEGEEDGIKFQIVEYARRD